MLIPHLLFFGLILTGFVHIVHPPTARTIAKTTGKVCLMLFLAQAILAYLWEHWMGRLVLISAAVFIVTRMRRGSR
jgi:hypothetical protein